MKILKNILLASVLIAPALGYAGAAQAQVSGIAIAQPENAILGAKALDAANSSIDTTYKVQLDQARARQQSLSAELTTILAPLGTGGKAPTDKEIAAAEAAKNPIIDKAKAAQAAGQADVQRFNLPPLRAQAFAIEQILQKYQTAVNTVAAAKKISLVLGAGNVQFNAPSVDVSDDIRVELDRILPTVSIAPPADWQPAQQTIQLQQQLQQMMYVQALRAQQQGQGPTGPTPPTPSGKKPAGR